MITVIQYYSLISIYIQVVFRKFNLLYCMKRWKLDRYKEMSKIQVIQNGNTTWKSGIVSIFLQKSAEIKDNFV